MELQKAISLATTAEKLEAFAKWLFATVAVVGTLGAALGATGFNELHGNGRTTFALAIVFVALSLMAAVASLSPTNRSVNRNNQDEIRAELNRVLRHRARFLRAGAVFFIVALGLAGYSPLLSSRATRDERHGVSYTLGSNRALHVEARGTKLRPFSSVTLALQSTDRSVALPRVRTFADAEGHVSTALDLAKPGPLRSVTILTTWTPKKRTDAETLTLTVGLGSPPKVAPTRTVPTVKRKAKKPKATASVG